MISNSSRWPSSVVNDATNSPDRCRSRQTMQRRRDATPRPLGSPLAFGLNRPRPSSSTLRLLLRPERVVECFGRRLDPGSTTDDQCRGECGGRPMHDLVPPVHRYLHSPATRNLSSFFPVLCFVSGRNLIRRETGSASPEHLLPLARRRSGPLSLSTALEPRVSSHVSTQPANFRRVVLDLDAHARRLRAAGC
jgi:hypothetical protein